MPFWNGAFAGRTAGQKADAESASPTEEPLPPMRTWNRILVPAIGRPYSMRGLEVACRLARGTTAQIYLVYFIEVPRSLVLDATLPDDEGLAGEVIEAAQAAVKPYRVIAVPLVQRVRNARDGVLQFIKDEEIDLLVLGARPDANRGLPGDVTRELFLRSKCEVVLDYIADEK
jgi:nucleotide-binding universal stress UspA family protein